MPVYSAYAKLEVRVFYSDGKPYQGTRVDIVEVATNTLVASLATDSYGNATLVLPKSKDYKVSVNVSEPLYNRSYTESRTVTLISDTTLVFTVPWNSTQPPVYINGTPHYWLSIQVLWSDGYPFHGANVTVVDVATGKIIAIGLTDGTGFVHFLIPAGKAIKYTVNATNPNDATQTYYAEATVSMTQHYYFVYGISWISEFFAPEVMLTGVEVRLHRGQGYYFGNVSHWVVLSIWTNVPQTVTVELALYNVTGGTWVTNKTSTYTLKEGVNEIFDWISVAAPQGGYFKVLACIVKWEHDTDPRNNCLWSNELYLKPFVDIAVFILWQPVQQKLPWVLLPGDIIEISIGIEIPINTTDIPAYVEWGIESFDLKAMAFKTEQGAREELRVDTPGVVWRNITMQVSWTSRIIAFVNASHEWEDLGFNNYAKITIEVDPDVRISIVEKPMVVTEGQVFKVVVNVTSNVEPGKGLGWLTLVDDTTATILKQVEVELAPEKIVELEVKAPENPPGVPLAAHHISVVFSGYDSYPENNKQEFTLVVVSQQQQQQQEQQTVIPILVTALATMLATMAALTLITVILTVYKTRKKSR